MFPSHLLKRPPGLGDLASKVVHKRIQSYINSNDLSTNDPGLREIRNYLTSTLHSALQTQLLKEVTPQDSWIFPCLESQDRFHCRIHRECRLLYKKSPEIIEAYFTYNVSDFVLDFRKIQIPDHHSVLRRFELLISTDYFNNLTSLILKGGTVHTDDLLKRIEKLVSYFPSNPPNLNTLHLPVMSNGMSSSIARIPHLRKLVVDRTKYFDRKGLWKFSHIRSKTKYNLESFHLGVFRHRSFKKLDVSNFFVQMKVLTDFSLMEETRSLIKLGNQGQQQKIGNKVFTYSVVKIGIIDGYIGEYETGNSGYFECGLKSLKVVDRILKPLYLLKSCPHLTNLYIDWQEELSYPPFENYKSDWFHHLIRSDEWKCLAQKLQALTIVFPSSHSPNTYGLPLNDFTRLCESGIHNLKYLKLVGAGKENGPIPLLGLLKYCPEICELILFKTCVHVPDNYEIIHRQSVNTNVKIFNLVGDMSSLIFHNSMTTAISHYMPNLKELNIQPETIVGYQGLTTDQVRELSRLKKLARLSLPLSARDCEMNMPEVIFVLREFDSLRYLILSWGLWCESYDFNIGKIKYMMNWLYDAIGAENANINLQLDFKMHRQQYR